MVLSYVKTCNNEWTYTLPQWHPIISLDALICYVTFFFSKRYVLCYLMPLITYTSAEIWCDYDGNCAYPHTWYYVRTNVGQELLSLVGPTPVVPRNLEMFSEVLFGGEMWPHSLIWAHKWATVKKQKVKKVRGVSGNKQNVKRNINGDSSCGDVKLIP